MRQLRSLQKSCHSCHCCHGEVLEFEVSFPNFFKTMNNDMNNPRHPKIRKIPWNKSAPPNALKQESMQLLKSDEFLSHFASQNASISFGCSWVKPNHPMDKNNAVKL